jgi:glutamate formiminotransferase / 5-formyltetrahydrofolate cyclo-ligase
MAKYILSDPNFSDGTHSEVIEKIIDQFRGRPGVSSSGTSPILILIASLQSC